MLRRTKIVATLGPATDRPDVLRKVINAGLDVARINFSHGNRDDQRRRVEMLREIASECGRDVGIMGDLQGPKIRVRRFAKGMATLKDGAKFFLDPSLGEMDGTRKGVGVAYDDLHKDVRPGDTLLLNDGQITLSVDAIEGTRVLATVVNGGVLSDHKGINRRGGGLSAPALTEKDRDDIRFAAELKLDFLAVSFVRRAEDVVETRRLLREAGGHGLIVAKIERTEAVACIDEIIDVADVIMVARGDLGVEIGDEELPGLQKRITRTALRHNRVVATATQMMQSMIENPVPTRAEVLDVANAVIDGTDAVMLSAETAIGKYPVRVIEAMNRICLGAERHFASEGAVTQLNVRFQRIDQAIAMAAMFMATNLSVQAIVALTESGSTAQWLSRVRSAVPIFAFSPTASSRRRMAMYRDVYPVHLDSRSSDTDQVIHDALQKLWRTGSVSTGDRVIVTMGDQTGRSGGTNTLRLIKLDSEGGSESETRLDLG
jgi:pyruvate kinase